MAFALSSPSHSSSFGHSCFFCPPLANQNDNENDNDDDDDEYDNSDFLPKNPNQSYETTLTGASTQEEVESEDNNLIVNVVTNNNNCNATPSLTTTKVHTTVQSSESPIQYEASSQNKRDSVEGGGRRKAATITDKVSGKNVSKVVVSPSAVPEESNQDDEQTEEIQTKSDGRDEDDIFFSIRCTSRYECADDDQSDASSLTMPSFRPVKGGGKTNKLTPKSKFLLQKMQKAVFASMQALRLKHHLPSINSVKNRRDGSSSRSNDDGIQDKKNVPSCTCLILLTEPSSKTFEIVPMLYRPGITFVSELLEQIPLQSTFNFRLRFQNYSGLMAIDQSIEAVADQTQGNSVQFKYYQLAQSKPVPMRYSCEFHHYQKHHHQEIPDCPYVNGTMMPLVAVLPGQSPQETTERLARKVLSLPSVLQRLDLMEQIVLSTSQEAITDRQEHDDFTENNNNNSLSSKSVTNVVLHGGDRPFHKAT